MSTKDLARIATNQDLIIDEVLGERRRQNEMFGTQNHDPADWMVILGEEFGEVCRAIYERNTINYREELIQVAAVAVAMLECLDKQRDEE